MTIESYISQLIKTLGELPLDKIARIVAVLDKVRDMGRRVYIFGNGGSASTASHFASDLNKGAIIDAGHGILGRRGQGVKHEAKPRFKAFCLNDNIPVLTAWANDTHFGMIFAEQLENFVEAGDVVIAISGSGNSVNVLNAVRLAKARRVFAIAFTGFDGGMLKGLVDIAVVVPSDNMEQIEDVHLVLGHIITTCLRSGI